MYMQILPQAPPSTPKCRLGYTCSHINVTGSGGRYSVLENDKISINIPRISCVGIDTDINKLLLTTPIL